MSNQRSSSNATPWLSDYVLQQLRLRDGDENASRTGPIKLVQILSRGGTFWQTCQVTEEAWMVVTDGEHAMVAQLTLSCRRDLLKETQTAPPGPMRFINYARGSIGLLEAYTFRSSPSMALMVQKWTAKPGLQGMIAQTRVIQPIDEHIPVRQVMQQLHQQQQQQPETTQGTVAPRLVLGSVKDAINDPQLFEELVKIALEATQGNGEREDGAEGQEMIEQVEKGTPTKKGQEKSNESDSSDDDEDSTNDKDMAMNLKDMLATQGDENMTQPSPARPVAVQNNPPVPPMTSAMPPRNLKLVDASTQTSPLPETLLPAPIPIQQPITRETTTPVNNTSQKRKRTMSLEGPPGINKNSSWHRFKEQLEDPDCSMIDVRLPTRPRKLPFRISRWLHSNLVEDSNTSSLWMPPLPQRRLS